MGPAGAVFVTVYCKQVADTFCYFIFLLLLQITNHCCFFNCKIPSQNNYEKKMELILITFLVVLSFCHCGESSASFYLGSHRWAWDFVSVFCVYIKLVLKRFFSPWSTFFACSAVIIHLTVSHVLFGNLWMKEGWWAELQCSEGDQVTAVSWSFYGLNNLHTFVKDCD